MVPLIVGIVVVVVLIFLTNPRRWQRLSKSARQGKEGFADEIKGDEDEQA